MPEGRLPNDTYEQKGVTVIFDKYNRLGAIELTPPAEAIFQGKDLLQLPWSEAKKWLTQLDADLEEQEDGLVSFKYGITVFAPDKTEQPNQLPTSVTAFKKNYFYVKDGIPDPQDISSFHIHVAFIEGITTQSITFENVEDAIKSIFSNVREFGILMINGIPIRFSYKHDLPFLLKDWVELVNEIQSNESGTHQLQLKCPAFQTDWAIKWDKKFIQINANWKSVEGGYEEALNEEAKDLLLLKKEFIAEWKMLFRQFKNAFKTTNLKFSENEKEQTFLKQINSLEKSIPSFGKFYSESEKIFTIDTTRKRNIDLKKAPIWLQAIVIGLIFVFVLLPVWTLSKDKDSAFWFWSNTGDYLMYLTPFLLIIVYFVYRVFKVRYSSE